MGLDLKRITVYARNVDPRTGEQEQRLVEYHPALRLRGEGATFPVWIQDGMVWGEGGSALKEADYPAWLAEELAHCAPAALEAVGYVRRKPAGGTREADVSLTFKDGVGSVRQGPPDAEEEREDAGVESDAPEPQRSKNTGAYTCPLCHETMWKVQIAAHRRERHPLVQD